MFKWMCIFLFVYFEELEEVEVEDVDMWKQEDWEDCDFDFLGIDKIGFFGRCIINS